MTRQRGLGSQAAFASLLLLGSLCGCAPHASQPLAPTTSRSVRSVDFPLAWTPDGRTIAYSRVLPSSDGPPGVYLLDLESRQRRWTAPANILTPKRGRFTSDGMWLCCVIANQITTIHVPSGTALQPFYTSTFVESADWLPQSHVLVYSRRFAVPEYPPDSAGFHTFDIDTRTDRPIHDHAGMPIGGREVTLIPHSTWVAYFVAQDIRRLSLADGNVDTLHTNRNFGVPGYLTSYAFPLTGRGGLLFVLESGSRFAPFLMDANSRELTTFPAFKAPYAIPSPDGTRMLRQGVDYRDSSVVLFVDEINNPTSAPATQVTFFR